MRRSLKNVDDLENKRAPLWNFLEPPMILTARVQQAKQPGLDVIVTFFLLNSDDHEIFLAHKC